LRKISFTTDIWPDPDRKPYMAVTAYWMKHQPLQVSQTLQHRISLRADLIGFIHMPGSHTGAHLAEMFLYILNRLQIANKVSFILIILYYIYMFYRLDRLL
jgi:hypothetical protein